MVANAFVTVSFARRMFVAASQNVVDTRVRSLGELAR
jgi:hypothetical protein